MKIDDKHIAQVKEWAKNPLKWIEDTWSENIRAGGPDALRLSTQQKDGFKRLGELVSAKMKLEAGLPMTQKEKDLAAKFGISIQSGNGTGKDAFAALCILWFMGNFPECKIPATANSAKQLRNVLWAEIAKWMGKANRTIPGDESSPTILEHLFSWQAEKISNKEYDGKTWFAEAVTINTKASDTEQAEAIAGRHERFMMIVVDEASGIAESVFNKFEATMTNAVNFALLIFNPTRAKGYAINSQKNKHWIALRWNAEESELVDKVHVERILEKYGRESNPYRIRVLGLPPQSDSDTLIEYDWIMDSVDREIKQEDPPVFKGVDVGGGGDKSIILTRVGATVTKITRSNTKDTMALAEKVASEILMDSPDCVMVDPIGIGRGVYDALHRVHKMVKNIDVRHTARNEQRFFQLRDELWWKVRDQFEQDLISIPNDRDLIDQLSSIKWEPNIQGKIKVQSKKNMKSMGMESPDEADALCLTYSVNEAMYTAVAVKPDKYERAEQKRPKVTWMGA